MLELFGEHHNKDPKQKQYFGFETIFDEFRNKMETKQLIFY